AGDDRLDDLANWQDEARDVASTGRGRHNVRDWIDRLLDGQVHHAPIRRPQVLVLRVAGDADDFVFIFNPLSWKRDPPADRAPEAKECSRRGLIEYRYPQRTRSIAWVELPTRDQTDADHIEISVCNLIDVDAAVLPRPLRH